MSYADVLPSAPKYEFKGIQHMLQLVEGPEPDDMDPGDPYVIYTIDERTFNDCYATSDERSLRKAFEAYDPSTNELLMNVMESRPHAVGGSAFTELFVLWLGRPNLNDPLVGTGRTVYQGTSNMKKSADCSWTLDHREWPTIVVEVVYSETPAKMMKDVRFWLTECSGQVSIVLTINILERGRISIEQWKMGARAPVPVQKLEITRNPAPKCEKIQGRMRLYYEDIYLRPKGPNDTDFIISHEDLELLADQVWGQQDDEDEGR
ncbi:hypothetical protein PENPOL_c020G01074 [Penicillium polonicum]|uniref:Restriction endonuclease domain-containing protein n=1 Tax=Penicillium polonicum TaxID=60169 RepID=A0A1V6N8T4_PENPO|nr:hypothetical protein PENPOL_c020G01074 [Penicillium polonicum]